MEFLFNVLSFLLGAAIPGFLLWRKEIECRHLLNVLLRKEKVPTTDKPFEGVPDKPEQKNKGEYKDRRSRPTAIDILMNQAEVEDTEEYLRQKGITTEH